MGHSIRFAREFKLAAVKLLRERGVSAAQVARDLRVPRPLLLVPHERSDSALPKLAEKVLTLTKVNETRLSSTRSFHLPSRQRAKSGALSSTLSTARVTTRSP